jgi:hypothetical protein
LVLLCFTLRPRPRGTSAQAPSRTTLSVGRT